MGMREISRRTFLAGGAAIAATACAGPVARPGIPERASGVWSSGAPAPSARSEVGGAAIGGVIYVAGGLGRDAQRGDFTSDALEAYDVAADRWTVRAPLPEPIHHPGVTALDGLLYLVGGYAPDWRPLASAYRYDPAADRWEKLPSLPTARGALVAVAAGGRVWAIGGRAATDVAAVEAFDPMAGVWTRQTAMPTPRDHHAAAVIDGTIYVVGGRLDGRGNLDVLEAYDPTLDQWTTLAPLPTARSGIAAAVLDGRMWVFGGEGDRIFGDNEVYAPATGRWERDVPMPTPRHGLAAAPVGDAIYVVAGGPQPGYFVSDLVEIYRPARAGHAFLPIVGS
ncbi:MAG: hypothetical protein KatS3mg060_0063 [Dehalococcoidia bacterium]|nr:MAG: hypothetical protein KatS3mg060_0063 [Dehalococcoidia bacterium]